jgi:hypothetical protein
MIGLTTTTIALKEQLRPSQLHAYLPRKELTSMAAKTSKTRPKRLSKGQRTHVRRLKQAARKAGIVYRETDRQ